MSASVCEPLCEGGCYSGDFTAPNIHTCHSGCEKHYNECIPNCKLGCKLAVDTDLGICTCEGFTNNSSNPTGPYCVPEYPGACVGGCCVAPDIWRYNEGYRKCVQDVTSKQWLSFCPGGCVYANFTAPNMCSCSDRYRRIF